MFRAVIAAETATRRNAVCPDYSGSDNLLIAPLGHTGAVVAVDYTRWVATLERDDAQVLKQNRLFREEMSYAERKPAEAAGSGDVEGQPRAKAKGRARGRGRGGADV